MIYAVGGMELEARRRLLELERADREDLAFLRLVADRRPALRSRIETILWEHQILKDALRVVIAAERAKP